MSTSPPPPDPEALPRALLPALTSFERGDFRQARRELERLAAAAPGTARASEVAEVAELAHAAAALRGGLDIDPAAFAVGGAALGLLVLVATTYLF